MKKIFFLILLFLCGLNIAQSQSNEGCNSKTTPNEDVVFYGIDYSLVRFSYIVENPEGLIQVLPHINLLFEYESNKYDVGGYFNRNILKTDLTYAKATIEELDPSMIVINEPSYTITEDEIKALLQTYPDEEETGVGLTFIAEHMNRRTGEGSYYIVFFDLRSKELLSLCWKVGKAGGGGVRNYWASTIRNIIKTWK